jgi:hypothetical protein
MNMYSTHKRLIAGIIICSHTFIPHSADQASTLYNLDKEAQVAEKA